MFQSLGNQKKIGLILLLSCLIVILPRNLQKNCLMRECDPHPASDPNAFITIWDTTQSGISNVNQITLPLESEGLYNFVVDWGDGATDNITN